MRTPASPPARGRASVAGALCAVLVLAAGCTGGSDDADAPKPSSSPVPSASTGAAPTLEARPVPLTVRVTRVAGRLDKKARASLERNIGRTLDRYLDAAYLGGDYPRRDFDDAFAAFSRPAARTARHDRGFLTNAALAGSTTAVLPKQKKAWLSVLAPNRVAAGVTARIRLVYVDVREAADQRVTVDGRLLLTRKNSGGWHIFGYDVSRRAHPTQKGAAR